MPAQVQRRQSEPIPITQKSMQQHQALRLALGSILTPKRPPVHQNSGNSRPSSGAASPAVFFAGAHSSSGSHTPIGSPPTYPSIPTSASGGDRSVSYYPLAQGPNSSEHLHPYSYGHPSHARSHGHSHTHIPLPPSRLGPGRSTPSNSPTSSAPNSTHPSPSVNSIIVMSPPSDIEPLSMPPPIIVSHPYHVHAYAHHHHHHHHQNSLGGIEPPPPTPSMTTNSPPSTFHHHDPSMTLPPPANGGGGGTPATMTGVPSAPAQPISDDHCPPPDAASNGGGSGHASGRGTPRAKFLETLQGKSAWDALIHGSFS